MIKKDDYGIYGQTLIRVCLQIAASIRIVIPAKAGIQSFQHLLDAGSSPA